MGDVSEEGGRRGREVALFVTCLVDQVLPHIGQATVKLLRQAGCQVSFPTGQTCCGQPFFNSGFHEEAKELAKRTIRVLEQEPGKAVVLPSGSCAAMISVEYAHLLADDPTWSQRARAVADRTFELSQFLVEELEWRPPVTGHARKVSYHDSCHMCRLLKVRHAPRQLLQARGHTLQEMRDPAQCCGFGGIFSVKMPEISNAMSRAKLRQAEESGAPLLVTSDPGCLMQLQGVAAGSGASVRVTHLATLLGEGDSDAT